MGAVLSAECERARKRVSLGLDGELSQIDGALLRAHVGRCAACAEFGRDIGALTQELRTAPLERPRGAALPERRRGTGRRVLQLGAAAAAVALAAGLGSLAGSLTSRSAGHTAASAASLHAFRVAELSQVHPARLPGTRLQQSAPV